MDEQRVVELVREELRRHHPGGVTIEVIDGDVKRQDDFWYVGVRPSGQPPKMYEYYEALADAEATLEETQGVFVFLSPSLPQEALQPGTEEVLAAEV